jgi:hypothetical protein
MLEPATIVARTSTFTLALAESKSVIHLIRKLPYGDLYPITKITANSRQALLNWP